MAEGLDRLLCLLLLTVTLVTAEHTPVTKISTTPWLTASSQSSIRLVPPCVCAGDNLLCAIEPTTRGTSNPFVIPRNAHYVRLQQPLLHLQLNRKVRLRSSRARRPAAVKQRVSDASQDPEGCIYKCIVATNDREDAGLKMKCVETKVIWNDEDLKGCEKLFVSFEAIFDQPFKMKLNNAGRFERTPCVRLSKLWRENPIFSKSRRHIRAVAAMSSSQISSTSTATKGPINADAQTNSSQKQLQTTSPVTTTIQAQPETTSQVKIVQTEPEPVSQASTTTLKISSGSTSTPVETLSSSSSIPGSMSSSYMLSSPTREPFTATDSLRSDPKTYAESSVTPDHNLTRAAGNTTPEIPLNSTSTPETSGNATEHNNIQTVIQEIDVNELRSLLVLAAVTRLASRPTVWGAFIGLFFGCVIFVVVVFLTCAKVERVSKHSEKPSSVKFNGMDTTLRSRVPSFPDSGASSSRESGYTSYNGSSDSQQNELCSSNPSVHSHSIKSSSNTIKSDGSREVSATRHDNLARSISSPVPHYGETNMDTSTPFAASAVSFENIITALSTQAGDKSVSLTITCNSLPRPKQSARAKESIVMKLSSPSDRDTSLRRGVLPKGSVDEEGYSHLIEVDRENGRYLTIDEDSDCCSSSDTSNSRHEYDNFYEDNTGTPDDNVDPPPWIPRRIKRPVSTEGKNYVNVEEFFKRSDENRCSWV
ncbi:unnamed protein product [Lymnaea stagnalis]|uniref:Uncharacterized protein n=1 Tax=Lymnaea stagnalis TaxID=6523 RepID=A0AAV2IPH0_LYMST